MDYLIQIGGSLAAILTVVWLVRRMKLGGDIRISDEAHARQLADEVESGFEPVDISIDKAGYGALMRDADGRVLVLRQHGTHFAGRIMTSRPDARLDQHQLTIRPDDNWFGAVTLDLGQDAAIWASSLRRLEPRNA